jgi:hypothetical protein
MNVNKHIKNPEQDWEGAFFSTFEEEMHRPSDENWIAIEQELFPKKKRKFAAFWFIYLVFFGLVVAVYMNSSTSDDKIISIPARVRTAETKSNEVNENQGLKIRTNSSGKTEHSTDQNNVVNTNKYSEKLTLTTKYQKSDYPNSSENNGQNRTEQPPSFVLTNSNPFEVTNQTKSLNEKKTGIINEPYINSDGNSSKIDPTLRLTFLPLQLLTNSSHALLQENKKRIEVGFKPFLSIYIGPLIGRNIRKVRGTFNSENTNSNAIGDRRVSLPKYGIQAGIDYQITKQLSLNSGFQFAGGDVQSRWFFKYLQIDPVTNDIRLKTTSGEASTADPALIQSITNGTTGIYKIRLNHSFVLYSIPIGITYRFTENRFSPYLRTGINMEFFGKRTLSIDVLEDGMTRNIELNLNRPNNRLSLQAILALGIESKLKGNWKFFTEAGYYLPLNQFINANGYAVRMAGSSIIGGIRYDLK